MGGGITVLATQGNIQIVNNSALVAANGILTLQDAVFSGNIRLGSTVLLNAANSSAYLVVGGMPVPPFVPGTVPVNVTVSAAGGGNAYFGQNFADITASGPVSINVSGGNVVFNVDSNAQFITLGSGDLIQAGLTPPSPWIPVPPPPLPPPQPPSPSSLPSVSLSLPTSPFAAFLSFWNSLAQAEQAQLNQQFLLNEQIGTRIATDNTPWTSSPMQGQFNQFPLQGNVAVEHFATTGEALFAASGFNSNELSVLANHGIVFGPGSTSNLVIRAMDASRSLLRQVRSIRMDYTFLLPTGLSPSSSVQLCLLLLYHSCTPA